MILYYTKGACSLAVRILINELNIPCQYIAVDLQNKKLENGKDFLQINSKGYVPALQTDDGKILSENAVIHIYLAETHKKNDLLPPTTDFYRYHVLEWLLFVTTELHKGFGPLFNAKIDQKIKEEIFIPNLKKKFAFIEKNLEQYPYLAGNHYTLPDGYFFVMLLWAEKIKVDLTDLPRIQTYYRKMSGRPAIKKSLQEEGLLE